MGRVGVVPEKSHTGTDEGGCEDYQFPGVGDVHDVEVLGKNGVTAQVGKNGDGQPDDGRGSGRQTINPIGNIGPIGNCRNDENRYKNVEHWSHGITQESKEIFVVEFVVFEKRNGCF